MRPSFQPRLINDPFWDPGLFIPFLYEKRALIFDVGDLGSLSSRDLLKISHVFVTHTHMDHFIGFDAILRTFLGREKTLHIYGPPGFFGHLEGKLAAYTWNLVGEYQNAFNLEATEVHPDRLFTKTYACRDHFRARSSPRPVSFFGTLLEEPSFTVSGVLLDHRTPCLGLSLQENFSVNIIKEGLRELDLPVGPWLNEFKSAVYEGRKRESDFPVRWKEKGRVVREKLFRFGKLFDKIARVSPGQKITYIADVIGSTDNREKIVQLAEGSDILFIEAAFMDRERQMARKKYHLTAKEAGELAALAGAKAFQLFHFSPRYKDQAEALETEAREAFEALGLGNETS